MNEVFDGDSTSSLNNEQDDSKPPSSLDSPQPTSPIPTPELNLPGLASLPRLYIDKEDDILTYAALTYLQRGGP